MYEYKIKVNKVIDGDTIDVTIDLGFNIHINERVRLFGINAPETRTTDLAEKALGLESKKFLEALLTPKPGTVQNVTMICDEFNDERGKYGRIIGTVFVDDLEVNLVLVNEGFASVAVY